MTPRAGALLAAPFLLVVVAARCVVPAWGDSIARRVTKVATVFRWVPSAPAPRASAPTPVEGALGAGAPPVSIHVPARAVQLAIDDEGVRVRARTAVGPDGRPAGVRLTGVSGLDAGLKDGDVIVAVEGLPTMDEGAAADVSLAAVARGASVVHATAMRGDQPVLITADWPRVAVLRPAPAATAAGKAR